MASSIPDDVIEERLNNLGDTLARVESLMSGMDERLRKIETATITELTLLKTQVAAMWTKVDAHEDFIAKMKPVYTATMWALGVLGVLVIGFLWAMFTHEVQLVK